MKKNFSNQGRMTLAAIAFASLAAAAVAAPFTAGNVAVVRVGEGTTTLVANQAQPVFIDEYTPTGTFVQSIALPTAVNGLNFRCTLGGANTAEGSLSLSTNGQFLTLGGYDADPGTTGVVAGSSARVVARISASGAVDTTTGITDGFTGGRIASATTDDGTRFWAGGAGTGGGVRYFASLGATTSSPIVGTPNNNRWVQIFGGQLYTTISFNGSPNYLGIASVGAGLPTTGASGDSPTTLPGFPATGTHSNFGYFFADANTVYVADDGTAPNGGGIQKWTQSAGTWTQAGAPFPYQSPTAAPPTPGFRGLCGTVSGANVTLYATTTETNANAIVKFTSTDSGASFTSAVIATAPGTVPDAAAFRGVAMTPGTSVPTAVNSWLDYN